MSRYRSLIAAGFVYVGGGGDPDPDPSVGSRVTAPAPRSFGESKPVGAVQIDPGDDANDAIGSYSTAKTFWFSAGTHTVSTGLDYAHTLCGASGAVLTCPGDAVVLRTNNGCPASGTIRNLVFDGTGSTTAGQNAIVEIFQSTDWVVEDCEVRRSRAWGVFLGKRGTARGLYVHHNGQGGVKAYASPPGADQLFGSDDVLVEDCEIAYNNTRRVETFWEAGGFKMVSGQSAIIRRNHFHDNFGWSVWFDYTRGLHLVEDNLCEDESHGGVLVEPSADSYAAGHGNADMPVPTEIRYNTFRRIGYTLDGARGNGDEMWFAGAIYAFDGRYYAHHNKGEDLLCGVGMLQSPRNQDPVIGQDDPYFFSIEGSVEEDNEWGYVDAGHTIDYPEYDCSIVSGSDDLVVNSGELLRLGLRTWTAAEIGCVRGTGIAGGTIATRALTSNVVTLTTDSAHGFVPGDVFTVQGVGDPFDLVGAVAVSGTTGTTLKYAVTHANVSSGAAPDGATADTYLITVPGSDGEGPGYAMAYPGDTPTFRLSTPAIATDSSAALTIGSVYSPHRYAQNGLRCVAGWDRPPYEAVSGYVAHFDPSTVTIRRNTRTGLTSLGPAKHYYDTDGWAQQFRWTDNVTSADIDGSNTTTWADIFPDDGPFST